MTMWMKTVVGLFKTRNEAQFAINDLINCGVQPNAITLRSGNVEHHVWSEEEAADIEKVKGNEGQLNVQADVARMESRGNAHEATTHVGRADIAALTELGVPASDARYYSEGVDRGGYLLTVIVNEHRAEETAMIIQRHGAVEDRHGVWGGKRGTAETAPFEQSATSRVSPENEPLAHDSLNEQLERAEVFKNKEEVATDLAGKHVQKFVGTEVSLPSANIFGEHDILRFEALQREIQEGKVQRQ